MTPEELTEVVSKGIRTLNMLITQEAAQMLVTLSQGLPHYTHLICLKAVRCAARRKVRTVARDILLECAIPEAIKDAEASTIQAYQTAVQSTKASSLYPKILLACALSERDPFGNFAAKDVEKPLSEILGKPSQIQNYSKPLANLCAGERGPALVKIGHPRRYRYRFKDPLLQPYVVSRGLSEKMITAKDIINKGKSKLKERPVNVDGASSRESSETHLS